MEKLKEPIYVTKSFLPPKEEYITYLNEIWKTHWLTNNGKLHNLLEERLKQYLKVNNISLFVNGHSALDIAIKSLELSGEVITTPFSFASTTHAIVMNGLEPVFCDVKQNDFNIDADKIESLITDKTSAIVAVHVYGYPCDVEKIQDIANKYKLKVIYDAAHAFGVEINGKNIGSFGDVSMMSFHATKVFNTIEGGALLYSKDMYRKKFNLYKNFGIAGPEIVETVGLNAKMNEFQAAMGLANINYVDSEIEKRKKIVEEYRKGLFNIEGISFLLDKKDIKHNYAYFPIIIDEKRYGMTRDQIFDKLKKYNVYTRKYFYPLIINYNCYKNKYDKYNLSNAKYISDRVITLPLYGDFQHVEYVIDVLRS